MHEVGPVVCDYFKIGQSGKPNCYTIAFLLTGLEVSFKQKNKKVTSVPVDIGWLA